MKEVITLFLICAISAITLGYVNSATQTQRDKNIKAELEIAKKEVLTTEIKTALAVIDGPENIENNNIFTVKNNNGEILAYIIEFTAKGFAGDIKLIAGIDAKKITVTGLKPITHSETPGLGAKITEVNELMSKKIQEKNKNRKIDFNKPWFCEQYKDLPVEKIKLAKDGGEIDAITASTITSRAVTDALASVIISLKKNKNLN